MAWAHHWRMRTVSGKGSSRRRWTNSDLAFAAKSCRSMRETLTSLGLRAAGGNYENIARALSRLAIDTSHWTGKGHRRGVREPVRGAASLDQILKIGTTYQSNKLRRRLLKERIFEPRCAVCGLDTWLGQAIPLELDHIDGRRENNELLNLRLVCPNCHARTPTYRGRNIGARLRRVEPVS